MSSMVLRNPPVLGSVNQAKDLRWMSIRLGSSRGVSRRANDRRVRGASTEAKAATPRGGGERRAGALYNLKWLESATSKDSTGDRRPREGPSALTDPALGSAYVARIPAYRAAATIGRQPRSVGEKRRGGHSAAPSHTSLWPELLEFDARAGLLEIGLELVGLLAVDALLDRLGGLVDERLGLLEAEAGRRADDLDRLDLLVARRGEDDVDGRRLLLLRPVGAGAGRGGRPGGRRRGPPPQPPPRPLG